jgi:ADP-ribosylglycohydrolase
LAFWTLEQMLKDSRFMPERVAERFCQGRIFGIGGTVREFIRNCQKGVPWYRCGPRSAGNGALMRIAPMLIPHLRTATAALWIDTALSAMITHNDSGSIAACLAFINILWQLLHRQKAPEAHWWPRTYVAVARELECGAYRPRGREHLGFYGPIWKFVEETLEDAYGRGLAPLEANRIWCSGAFLLETVPAVLYILMRHAHDPEEAIIRAVNDTKDNDTIAALVGAAVGALHGRRRIPARWLTHLTGRMAVDDDGRVFELLAAAKRSWWQTP